MKPTAERKSPIGSQRLSPTLVKASASSPQRASCGTQVDPEVVSEFWAVHDMGVPLPDGLDRFWARPRAGRPPRPESPAAIAARVVTAKRSPGADDAYPKYSVSEKTYDL